MIYIIFTIIGLFISVSQAEDSKEVITEVTSKLKLGFGKVVNVEGVITTLRPRDKDGKPMSTFFTDNEGVKPDLDKQVGTRNPIKEVYKVNGQSLEIEISKVNGKLLEKTVFLIVYGSYGDIPTIGSSVSIEGYETGGFVGYPPGGWGDRVFFVDPSNRFYFEHQFVVTKVVK